MWSLKISRDALVLMKGQHASIKLYVMQGSTVTCDATVASHKLSNDDDQVMAYASSALMRSGWLN